MIIAALTLSACNPFSASEETEATAVPTQEVVETTATPSPTPDPTSVALTTENSQLKARMTRTADESAREAVVADVGNSPTPEPPTLLSPRVQQETVAPTPAPTVNVDVLAANIAASMSSYLPSGAPPEVQVVLQEASHEAATQLVAAGGNEEDAVTMAASLFNALRDAGAFCWADKTATWSENYSASGEYLGPQRLEISQHQQNVSHLDYYRGPGSAAISILVRGGEEAVLLGNGSLWEYPGDRCNGFDFLEDLSLYAAGRPDWGHSGLVFANLSDALNGEPALNPRGLSASQIDALRPILFTEDSAKLAQVRAVTGFTPDDREAACKAVREDHPPVDGSPWRINASEGPVIVNFWSNWPGIATAGEAKIMIQSGTLVLRGGGSAFYYPKGCDDVAAKGYGENLNSPWTVDGSQLEPYIVR